MACLTKSFHSQHLLREVAYAVNSDYVTLASQSWGATSDGLASVTNLVAHLASGPSNRPRYRRRPQLERFGCIRRSGRHGVSFESRA